MTTNKPDTLDEALVRAGRIDVRIGFSHATRTQIRDIFVNMYHPSGIDNKRQPLLQLSNVKHMEAPSNDDDAAELTEALLKQKYQEQHDEVRRLAEVFADRVPHGVFSPAELQDYLILHKNKPEVAIEGTDKFVADKLGEMSAEDEDEAAGDSDASTAAASTGVSDEDAGEKSLAKKVKSSNTGK